MKGSQEEKFLSANLSTKNPVARFLKLIDDKPQMPPECNDVIMDGLSVITKQALQNGQLGREDMEKLSIVLKTVSLLASYEEEPKGLTQLLDKGLIQMINILVATLSVKDCANSGIDQFLEDILEVIGAISDYSTKAKSYVVETFCNKLMQVVTSLNVQFTTKMETLKTINLILEGCPLLAREKMKKSLGHKELIQRVCSLILSIGDYEFQVGIIEALFRLSNKSDRAAYARDCFTNKDCLEAFFQIRDSDFETDCRRFLNILNEKNAQKSRVISVPCRMACLGDYELVKPADTNYSEFWVDFNIGSKRISLFCNPETPLSQDDEEGMWETVSVWHSNLLSYTCKGHGSWTEAKIELKGKARDLIGFGPKFSDNTVSLHFDSKADVKTALELTFSPPKVQQKAARKVSQSIDALRIAAREENFQRGELQQKIATAAVTPAKRPHVSVPCQLMNRPPQQRQPVKASCHDVAGPPLNEKSPKPPRTPTGRGTRGVKRVKTPLQLVSSTRSDESAHTVVESSTGGQLSQTKSRKMSVGTRPVEPDKSTGEMCQMQCDNASRTEEKEVVIPSSVPEEPAAVIYDSQLPAKDLPKVLNDTEKKKEMYKLDKRFNCSSETKLALDTSHTMPMDSSPKDHYEVAATVALCDVYVKDTLRASLPPILSTVSEESSTPCIGKKSLSTKLAAERGRVEREKARTLNKKPASNTRTVGGITMMSPDSTSQSTTVAFYHKTEGAGMKKRKRKRRKKASRTKAKKAAATRRKPPSKVGPLSSQDGSSDGDIECLSEEETGTVNLFEDDDFKRETKPSSRRDAHDLTEAPAHQRLSKKGKEAGNSFQEQDDVKQQQQKDSSMKKYKEADEDDSCILDHWKTQQNKEKDQEQSKTTSKYLKEKQKQQDKETNFKKQPRLRKKSQDEMSLSNDFENKGKMLSGCQPNDSKATKETLCCIDSQDVVSSHEDNPVKTADVEATGTQTKECNFGSQINDYEPESQDVALIHRDDFEDNVESQESTACNDDVNEVEQSKIVKEKTVTGSFKERRKEKELKCLQDSKSAKKMVNPYGFEDHGETEGRAAKKIVDPYQFEHHGKTGGRSTKKMVHQNSGHPDKRRNKESMMGGLSKQLKVRKSGDDSSSVRETSSTHVKPPKFFKSRYQEKMEKSRLTFDSSDDIYSFEPNTNANHISKKNKMVPNRPDRKGDDTTTDDELLSDSQGQSKLTKSISENIFRKNQNKPRSKKSQPKDNKVKKGSEDSDATHEKHCESMAVDVEKPMKKDEDKPKYKLKCLSTLRERFQASALNDFEDAVATNFGFDDDGEEHVGESVAVLAEDYSKKGNSKCLWKEKNTSRDGNMKQKARENKATKNSLLKMNAKLNKTQKEKETDTYKPASPHEGGDTSEVEELTRLDIPNFSQLCRGLIEESQYNFRSVNRRPSKCVNYKDMSDSEIDATSSVHHSGTPLECVSTVSKQSAGRKQVFNVHSDVRQPVRKRYKKSVFSETDEGAETRSEVSWLGSTARKGKPQPARTYRNRAGKMAVHRAAGTESEASQSDRDEPICVIHKKKATRKRRKVASPRHTEGEDSEAEPLYYHPKLKKSATNKENLPSAMNKHRKETPQRKDFVASFKSSLQRFTTPSVMTPVTPKTPTSIKGSNKGRQYQAPNMQINKTPVIPGSCLDISMEEFRFENLQLTPYTALDSPIMLEREVEDDVNLAESVDENMEIMPHVPRMRSCSTPRSYRSMSSYNMTPAIDKKGLGLTKALEDMTKSGPYKKTLGKPAMHKRQMQYADDESKEDNLKDEHGELYSEEDKGEELSRLEVSIRPRKLFHDNDSAEGRLVAPGNDDMPEERFEEEEGKMEEEGTTSVSEVGTSLPGDLEIGISIAGLGKSFGTELQRNMLARKQSVEQLTRHALKVTQRQVTSLWSQQHVTRKQLLSEFRQNLLQEVYSLEADCSKCNDAEEKVLACIKQQQKVIDSCKQSQGKRLQNIHMMRDEFMGTLTALDANERGHLSTIRETMRGEIQALQKKLLQQSQRQEMNQVKRAMQTLFL